jgi:hypothetical protein
MKMTDNERDLTALIDLTRNSLAAQLMHPPHLQPGQIDILIA